MKESQHPVYKFGTKEEQAKYTAQRGAFINEFKDILDKNEHHDLFYPEGWEDHVYATLRRMREIDPGVTVRFIKEKYGHLRIGYWGSGIDDQALEEVEEEAEMAAAFICHVCGRPGTIAGAGEYILPHCDVENCGKKQ